MKRKTMFLIIMIYVLFPIKISALSGKINLNCDNTDVKYGDVINCTVSGDKFDDKISSFHAQISLEEGLDLLKVTKDSIWQGDCENGIVDLYTDVNKSGKVNLFTFQFKVKNKNSSISNISVLDIAVGDSKFNEHHLEDVSIKINSNKNKPNDDNNNSNDNKNDDDLNIKDNENVTNNPQTGIGSSLFYIIIISNLFIIIVILYKKRV